MYMLIDAEVAIDDVSSERHDLYMYMASSKWQ